MNNGDPEDVSDYLGFIGKYILQALANLGEEGLTAAKRVAAMVLVDALNVCFLCNKATSGGNKCCYS